MYMVPKILIGLWDSWLPPSKFEPAPRIKLKMKTPMPRQMTIAKAETIKGKPPDVFFVLMVDLFCIDGLV
jgi:hypothetical protein